MEDQGIKVKYHHHEVGGPGQLEIEVEFGGVTEMADKTMMTKYLIKNEAIAEGKTATFMPKPVFDEAGNGMHCLLYTSFPPYTCHIYWYFQQLLDFDVSCRLIRISQPYMWFLSVKSEVCLQLPSCLLYTSCYRADEGRIRYAGRSRLRA